MTDDPSPIDQLLVVVHAVQHGRRAPAAALRWFVAAIDLWMTGEAATLDDAFGLRPEPGQRRASTRARQVQRDDALRAAASMSAATTPTGQAKHAATSLGRYASTTWLRTRDADSCPHKAGSLKASLWTALKAGDGRPVGERRIQQILETSYGCSFRTEPANQSTDGDLDDQDRRRNRRAHSST